MCNDTYKAIGFPTPTTPTTTPNNIFIDEEEFSVKLKCLYDFRTESASQETKITQEIAETINWLIEHSVISYLLKYYDMEKTLEFIEYFKGQEQFYAKTMTFVQAMNALQLDIAK